MFFQQENLAFQLHDILYLQQGYTKTRNTNRHYDALSFRIESDTTIEAGSQTISLQKGTIAYFPSNVEYTRNAKKDNLIVIHFKCFNFSGNRIESFSPDNPEKYEAMFQKILNLWKEKAPGYQHTCAAIFCEVLRALYLDTLPEQSNHSKIEASIRYIHQNMFDPDFSLTEAAKQSYISDVYFRKLFKEIYGISPKQYVIQNRIQHAASLILSGEFSLQEVASMCSYHDYKHFTTEFKRIMGISPSQYEYNHIRI